MQRCISKCSFSAYDVKQETDFRILYSLVLHIPTKTLPGLQLQHREGSPTWPSVHVGLNPSHVIHGSEDADVTWPPGLNMCLEDPFSGQMCRMSRAARLPPPPACHAAGRKAVARIAASIPPVSPTDTGTHHRLTAPETATSGARRSLFPSRQRKKR